MLTIGSMCSGIGGLDIGIEWALADAGFASQVAWQVEHDAWCRRVLAKHWPEADRSVSDVKRAGQGAARIVVCDGRNVDVYRSRRGLAPVDIIIAGYPCQPFSHAGKRGGVDDPRHLWPDVARAIRLLRPRWALLENVAGHLSMGLDGVLGDLAALGYDARWEVVSAASVGAPHLRERVFVAACRSGAHVADAGRESRQRSGERAELPDVAGSSARTGHQRERHGDAAGHGGEAMADAARIRSGEPTTDANALAGSGHARAIACGRGEPPMANADDQRQPQRSGRLADIGRRSVDSDQEMADADIERRQGRRESERQGANECATRSSGATGQRDGEQARAAKSALGGKPDGLPGGLVRAARANHGRWPAPPPAQAQYEWEAPRTAFDVHERARQLKGYGNAVVPEQAAEAARRLLIPLIARHFAR